MEIIKKYEVEKMTETREFITLLELNEMKEEITIEVTKVTCNLKDKRCLMNLWKKEGYIKKTLPTWWSITTYVTNKNGCWGRYNPQIRRSEDGKRNVINFDYVLEATEENKILLINEVIKRAYLFL